MEVSWVLEGLKKVIVVEEFPVHLFFFVGTFGEIVMFGLISLSGLLIIEILIIDGLGSLVFQVHIGEGGVVNGHFAYGLA